MTTVLLIGTHAQAASLEGPLSEKGYVCHAATAADVVERTIDSHADVVVAYADDAGRRTVAALRGDFRTRFVTIMVVADSTSLSEEMEDFLAHTDDYVFVPAEVAARVRILLRSPHASRGLNPLTGLAGKTILMEEIAFRLKARRHFAALYADLHNFKSYNQHYGFA